MLVTDAEAKERGLNIKGWLAELQIAAKEADAPTFKLKGACRLKVRSRRGNGAAAVSTQNWTFMGGEEFRVSSFFTERKLAPTTDRAGYTISVTLTPAKSKLAGEVSSMTLTLVEATELFEGDFEQWVTAANGRAAAKKTAAQTVVERVQQSVPQKAEENPAWGSW